MRRAWEYVDEHCVFLAGQSGLPFDRLWIRLRPESLGEWIPCEQLRAMSGSTWSSVSRP